MTMFLASADVEARVVSGFRPGSSSSPESNSGINFSTDFDTNVLAGVVAETGISPGFFRAPAVIQPPVPAHLEDVADQPARERVASMLTGFGWATVGLSVLVGAWALAAMRVDELPTPPETFAELVSLMSDPFRNGGPNDQGVALQLGGSLLRVMKGFAAAVVIGVPLGLLMGASRRAWKAVNPLIQLLRPVSPLAWFPIWLIVIKNAPQAAVVVIFITALWPIIINTAASAAAVPADQQHVAEVFRFNKRTYLRHVLMPNALPGIVTGMRLSMGVAWMVIVAVEMLSGGSGIGFFVWDAYNALNLARVVAAIVLIGITGLVLDVAFLRLGRRVALPGLAP